ncbi:hypothetical protein E0Z10_g7336 [Xylaria hypoxylon]|uniref:Uncharacterized protein n=1 Tax=Xylaria hypoxylon TaxID=37992 RepID=A0A4Z0YBU3_9PEZI|nr:hypothetical protein E0Z10_g7336 [Xylaria hypoxylon]
MHGASPSPFHLGRQSWTFKIIYLSSQAFQRSRTNYGILRTQQLARDAILVVVLGTLLVALLFQISFKISTTPLFPYRIYRVDECAERETQATAEGTHLTAPFLFKHNRVMLNLSHTIDAEVRERLLPKNTGVFWTKHNETFRLGMGISMFHAGHYLLFLRSTLHDHIDGLVTADTHSSAYGPKNGEEKLHLRTHVAHCFSYIAQQVMCLGDSTIEPPWIDMDEVGNIKKYGIDGYGVHHKCKDTTRMIEVARRGRTETFEDWEWKDGDTVESVFGYEDESSSNNR